jgi:DNA-binding FadR family transcriptional regulator
MGSMGFFRSKPEQLADYLRQRIRRHELLEPLPNTRTWCQQLGVCRRTLQSALTKLSREGLLEVQRRRIRLAVTSGPAPAAGGGAASVRLLI